MSLINEALKKAQRQRAPEAGLEQPGPEPGEVVVARSAPRSARSVALITLGTGVTVLAVALLTYFLSTGSATVVTGPVPPKTKPKSVEPKVAPPETPVANASAPTPSEPKPVPPSVSPATTPAPEPVAALKTDRPSPSPTPANADAQPAPAKTDSTAATAIAPPAPAPAPVPVPAPPSPQPATTPKNPQPSEQVQAFVDAVRVMGIRASGEDSRVLMNGRQYRLNEIVDRPLGVRLVKVEGNCLTFADPNGVVYRKFF